MDTRIVNTAIVPCERADLFGIYERARRRNLATCNMGRVRCHGDLFRRKKIIGNRRFELRVILRRVTDTCLAIGA